jgi:hypothetical protein
MTESKPFGPHSPLPKRWWLAAVAFLALGSVVGRLIPPPYPDGHWWGTFVTSAGFGGSLAVIGAGAAAWIAFHNSRRDRDQKQVAEDRTQWWVRFAWACEKAVSTKPGESEMGLSVLQALIDAPWARDEDNEMAIGVANVILVAIAPAPRAKWRSRP